MPRDTSTDPITKALIERYVPIISQVSGWGELTSGDKAIYPQLGLPQPQEPFPAAYIYLANQTHDWTQGQGIRRDINTINIRIIGGPITPGYKFVPELKVYEVLTGVVNELTYRPYLQDPDKNNEPFRYLDPNQHQTVGQIGRIGVFNYSDQGGYIGIEIPSIVALIFKIGRVS